MLIAMLSQIRATRHNNQRSLVFECRKNRPSSSMSNQEITLCHATIKLLWRETTIEADM